MRRSFWLVLPVALVPSLLAYAAAIGLGLHRHGNPWAVSIGATVAVFLPPLMVALVARRRAWAFVTTAALWSVVGWAMLPLYFPGERREAVSAGLAVLLGGAGFADYASGLAERLPDEPALAAPEIPPAEEWVQPALPPGRAVMDHEIVLPYEGEGRNLAIPVVFEHDGREVEVMMMLDTGATYTTLPTAILADLGREPGPGDPTLTLHTANGEREARVVGIEHVWLGDLRLDEVAVATCDVCRSHDTVGLLGLNVAGGFNVAIDADRREVTFTRRDAHDRKLDAKPWIDLSGRFARYPGGRVEVTIALINHKDRPLSAVSAQIRCEDRRWTVDLGAVDAGEERTVIRKLPRHEPCEAYVIALHEVQF